MESANPSKKIPAWRQMRIPGRENVRSMDW
nr:MAG TPA: hypothetical protein [Bacteriophage sp.]